MGENGRASQEAKLRAVVTGDYRDDAGELRRLSHRRNTCDDPANKYGV